MLPQNLQDAVKSATSKSSPKDAKKKLLLKKRLQKAARMHRGEPKESMKDSEGMSDMMSEMHNGKGGSGKKNC